MTENIFWLFRVIAEKRTTRTDKKCLLIKNVVSAVSAYFNIEASLISLQLFGCHWEGRSAVKFMCESIKSQICHSEHNCNTNEYRIENTHGRLYSKGTAI
jgi:hypothetical protein